jgi:hypothetical protein
VIHNFESEITEIPTKGPGPQNEQVPVPGKLGSVGAMTFDSGQLYVAEPGRIDQFSAPSDAFVSQLLDAGPLGGLDLGVGFSRSTGETLMFLGVEGPVPGVGVFRAGACGTLECAELQGEEWTGAHTPNESFVSEKGEGSGDLDNVVVDVSASLGDWARGDVFVLTRTTSRGQFPGLNMLNVFNPHEAVQKGDEPPSPLAQLRGTPVGETLGSTEEGEPFEAPSSVAVSGFNGDVVVVDSRESGSVLDLFEPVGFGEYAFAGRLRPPSGSFEHELGAVTIDGGTDGSVNDGDIYVAENVNVEGNGTRSVVYEFGPTGVFLGTVKARDESSEGAEETAENELQNVKALAIDPVSHRLYIGDLRDREVGEPVGVVEVFGANAILPEVVTEAPLPPGLEKGSHTWRVEVRGSVNPEGGGDATCSFVWGTSPAFGHVAPCVGAGENGTDPVLNGTTPVAVHASISGLEPGTIYYYRLQARNGNGTNIGEAFQDMSFLTPGPGFHGESVSDLSSTSVTFSASIDPDNEARSYRFEYDTRGYAAGEASHGVSVPLGNEPIGPGSADVQASQHVQGLSPHTTYHYRVVALSELEPGVFEEFDGPDRAFTTQSGGGSLSLLDGRGWELVSPANKHGALIFGLEKAFRAPVEASLDGSGVAYAAFTPTEAGAAGYSTVEQVVSRRGQGAAWSSRDVSPPHATPTGAETPAEYRVFSEDLSSGLVELFPRDSTLLSGGASEATPYARQVPCDPSVSECYTPLVSDKEGESKDVPTGTVFGGQVQAVGASPDTRHVVLRTTVQLTETPTEAHQELYEWSANKPGLERLQLISLLPEDEGGSPETGGRGSVDLGNIPGDQISSGVRPISADGSRVFWSAEGALYMRDTNSRETVRLDVAQAGVSGGEAQPLFETASADGSKAFFTDTQRLTAASSMNGADLYECEIVVSAGKDSCVLRDLTPEGSGGASEVQNLVLGASEGGSYVYFVANGVLGSSAPAGVRRGACREESFAVVTCNLYVYHDGEVRYIAALSSEDELDWGGESPLEHTIGRQVARVSPDGRFVAFMSVQSLTRYDNRDVRSGKPDAEVFEYDAQQGSTVCVSCDPTGARPAGREVSLFSDAGAANLAAVSNGVGDAYNASSWVAANLPAGVVVGGFHEALYLPRVLSDGGRLFFNSSDGLVPLDTNGQEDVYEFEPEGVGDCSSGALMFSGVTGGCTSLVSSGTSSGESGFLDASASGNDVFFLTGEALVGEDRDTALDVYDARVCAVSEPCAGSSISPPACATVDACRSAPLVAPAVFGSPATSTFSGPGNLVPVVPVAGGVPRAQKLALALRACERTYQRSRRLRSVCKREARRRYRVRRTRRSPKTRRAGR